MRKGESRAGVGTGALDGSLGEKRNESVKSKDEFLSLNGTALGSVNMQSAQLTRVTEFKYLGSTLHSDGDMNT